MREIRVCTAGLPVRLKWAHRVEAESRDAHGLASSSGASSARSIVHPFSRFVSGPFGSNVLILHQALINWT